MVRHPCALDKLQESQSNWNRDLQTRSFAGAITPLGEAQAEEDPSTFVDAMDIDFDDTSLDSTLLSSVSSSGSYKVPQVLISLQLEENQPLDAKECARWLGQFPLLAKWVKVEAVFPSYSTLMILSIPMPIWDMLPDYPACSFVGYVTGPSLVGLPASENVPAIEIPTVNESSGQATDTKMGGDPLTRVSSLNGEARRRIEENGTGQIQEPISQDGTETLQLAELPSAKPALSKSTTRQQNARKIKLQQKRLFSKSKSLKLEGRPKARTGCINCK
jgi:hypothetical protein